MGKGVVRSAKEEEMIGSKGKHFGPLECQSLAHDGASDAKFVDDFG